MKQERFYIYDIMNTGSLSQEDYDKIIEKQEDDRIYSDGDCFIFTKSEHKEEVEKTYNITMKPLQQYIKDYFINYGEIGTIISEESDDNRLLSYWNGYVFNEIQEHRIINTGIKKLYNMSDEEIIDFMIEGSYADLVRKEVKLQMIKTIMKKLKEFKEDTEQE